MNAVYVSSKKDLELLLERIKRFHSPKRYLEQYETPPSIVAHILWKAFMNGDILGKTVAELGCGVARFSLGSLMLGAEKVLCIDIDNDILRYASSALEREFKPLSNRIVYMASDIRDLNMQSIDTIIMNPPFGVVKRNRGLDMVFLRKALQVSPAIYTIHKYSKQLDSIVLSITSKLGYRITYQEMLDFPIPMMFVTHRRRIYRVKSVFYVIKRGVYRS